MKENIFASVVVDKAVSSECKAVVFIVILAEEPFTDIRTGGDGLNS